MTKQTTIVVIDSLRVNIVMYPHLREGRHIAFSVDPVGVGITLPCLNNIWGTSG